MVSVNKVFSIEIDVENFKSFMPVEDIATLQDRNISLRCKGQPLAWKETLEIEPDEEDVGMPEADVSLLNVGSFVITALAYEKLFKQYKNACEFLPMTYQGRDYYLVNVTNVVDCLDKDKSSFNEYGGVRSPVFDTSKLPSSGPFKIKEDNFTSIFCTDELVEQITKQKLTGIEFDDFGVA